MVTLICGNNENFVHFQALAIETADEHDCSLILANDPDADRLAVAEKTSKYVYRLTFSIGFLIWGVFLLPHPPSPSYTHTDQNFWG